MDFSSLNWVDWFIAVVVVLSTLLSLKRGFFREALSLVIWFFALVVSFSFHDQMSVLLQDYIVSESLRKVAGMAGLFVICLLIGGLFSFLVTQLIEFTGLSTFDRLLGMFFGFMRGVVMVLVVLIILRNTLPVYHETWWMNSIFIPHVMRMESSIMLLIMYVRNLVLPLVNGLF